MSQHSHEAHALTKISNITSEIASCRESLSAHDSELGELKAALCTAYQNATAVRKNMRDSDKAALEKCAEKNRNKMFHRGCLIHWYDRDMNDWAARNRLKLHIREIEKEIQELDLRIVQLRRKKGNVCQEMEEWMWRLREELLR